MGDERVNKEGVGQEREGEDEWWDEMGEEIILKWFGELNGREGGEWRNL